MSISRPHWLPPHPVERNLFRCPYEFGHCALLIGGLLFLAAAAGCGGPAWLTSSSPNVLPLPQPTTPAAAATPSGVPPAVAPTAGTAPAAGPVDQAAAAAPQSQPPTGTAAATQLEQLQRTDPQQVATMREILDQTAATLPAPYHEHLAAQLLAVASNQQQRQAAPSPAAPFRPRATEFKPLVTAAPDDNAVALPAPRRAPGTAVAAAAATATEPADKPAAGSAQTGSVAASVTDSDAGSGEVDTGHVSPAAEPQPADQADDFSAGQWLTSLDNALTELEQELARGDHDPADAARLQVCRRLLHAVANDRQKALTAIDAMEDDEQAYWKHLLFGLLTSLDADQQHVSSRRAALALRELRRATDHLANVSTLDVRNLAFCREVESYGRYTEFKSASFKPGQEVLLYVEVENFAAEAVAAQYETELQGEYQVFDAEGRRVAHVVLPLDKQRSNNRRRDYFIAYPAFLPQKIPPGAYTLQLTIEDVKGHKSNQASIDFRIR